MPESNGIMLHNYHRNSDITGKGYITLLFFIIRQESLKILLSKKVVV